VPLPTTTVEGPELAIGEATGPTTVVPSVEVVDPLEEDPYELPLLPVTTMPPLLPLLPLLPVTTMPPLLLLLLLLLLVVMVVIVMLTTRTTTRMPRDLRDSGTLWRRVHRTLP